MNLIELAADIRRIAREAGLAILDIYNRPGDWQVEIKGDDSPLTQADRVSNEIIVRQLPEYPIISEENKEIPFAERQTYTRCWLVDPLDGTKEFIQRNGDFTVNIALVENGAPILGVVHIPATNETYWAVKGAGAFLEEAPLQAATFALTDPGLKVVASRSHSNPETEAFIAGLNQPELVSRGSALKFLLLASGQAHVYPRLAPTMEWDTGAAQIVLEEAGGAVLQATTGAPLQYNKENLLNPHFIAYGQRL